MSEETLNARKNPILLRSFCGQRILPLVLVFVLLIPLLVFPALAVDEYIDKIGGFYIIDYRDYVQRRDVEGEYDVLTLFDKPSYYGWYLRKNGGSVEKMYGKDEYSPNLSLLNESIMREVNIMFRPYGQCLFSLANIPHQSELTIDTRFLINDAFPMILNGYIKMRLTLTYFDSEREKISSVVRDLTRYIDDETLWCNYVGSYVFDIPDDACYFMVDTLSTLDINPDADYRDLDTEMIVDHFSMGLNILTSYRDQEVMGDISDNLGDVNDKLDDVNDKLDDTNDKLDDTNDKLDDANDKLDDVNDNLETLPDEVGNEIQGVIDNEKNEAEDSGNKFVDQILGALPDPSTEVLTALKGLTDATSYTGTDAVLPIPAIVLPGIDGLFPETVIWEGAELDFGEYMNVLPPALLSLVRSLFTIAIVLFCVYELKGIISYCLTLRENKGG